MSPAPTSTGSPGGGDGVTGGGDEVTGGVVGVVVLVVRTSCGASAPVSRVS